MVKVKKGHGRLRAYQILGRSSFSYVLGAAIGSLGLLRCYPSKTLTHLRKWSNIEDEGTLWNVAMSFASYGGNKNWQEGMNILTKLATDDRRYVWRSVASALLYLARRHPEIQDTLRKWLGDRKRAKVAAIVLKHLTK